MLERVGEVDKPQRVSRAIFLVDNEMVGVVVSQRAMGPAALVEGADKLEPLRARNNRGVSTHTTPHQEE